MGEPVLVWSDEFVGPAGSPPDPARWGHDVGAPGTNDELQCYTSSPANAALDGAGHLVITARHQPCHRCVDGATTDHTSARLTTRGRFTTRYGRLQVRARLPVGVGTWPAFWALGADFGSVPWPEPGEIDVVEVVGKDPTVVHGAVHGPGPSGLSTVPWCVDTGLDLSAEFHVYAVDWGPDRLVSSFDGRHVRTVDTAEVVRKGRWVFDHPFFLLLNLAVGGTWPGPPSPSTPWPQRLVVDHVRVYRTAASGPVTTWTPTTGTVAWP